MGSVEPSAKAQLLEEPKEKFASVVEDARMVSG
jgi:hypothetical protein